MRILGLGAILGGSILRWRLFPESYVVRILGGLVGYILNVTRVNYSLKRLGNYGPVVIIGSIWFIPLLTTLKLREKRLKIGSGMERVADKGCFQFYGGQGLYYLFSQIFFILNSWQLNRIKVFIKIKRHPF